MKKAKNQKSQNFSKNQKSSKSKNLEFHSNSTNFKQPHSGFDSNQDFWFFRIFLKIFHIFFGWGALPPKAPRFLAEGAKPPRPSPLERPSLAFDRGCQTGPPRSNALFLVPLTIRRTTALGTEPPAIFSKITNMYEIWESTFLEKYSETRLLKHMI